MCFANFLFNLWVFWGGGENETLADKLIVICPINKMFHSRNQKGKTTDENTLRFRDELLVLDNGLVSTVNSLSESIIKDVKVYSMKEK